MTNNPTIDGVSREEFERSVATLYGHADLRKRSDGCYINDQIQSAWWGWKERSALLDAPAAERQEPASPLSDIGQAQLLAICRGSAQRCEEQHAYMASAISDPYNWFPHKWVLDAMSSLLQINANYLQSTIAQLEDKLNKAIDLDFQRRETIAGLEARVQELERGLSGMLFAFDDGVGRGWSAKTLDYARKLTPAVEFDATAALNGERK